MLLSMTGFGEARRQENGVSIALEVRTINSRYFKIALRTSDGYAALEPRIEGSVRQRIKRGTVQINLKVDRPASVDTCRLNAPLLLAYWRQLNDLAVNFNIPKPAGLESLLALPDVVDEQKSDTDVAERDWPLIDNSLAAATESSLVSKLTRFLGPLSESFCVWCSFPFASPKKIWGPSVPGRYGYTGVPQDGPIYSDLEYEVGD